MKIKENKFWRFTFCEEPAKPEGGSGGGAGGAPEDPPGKEPAGKEPEAPAIDPKEYERLKGFESRAKEHLDVDESGNIKPKVVAAPIIEPTPTPAELDQQRLTSEVAGQTVRLIEANNQAKTQTIEKFKATDPLFSKNFVKAEEKISKLPIEQRTGPVWIRAYHMAQGETAAEGAYEKHYKEIGKQEALAEMEQAGTITLPVGSGAGGAGGKEKLDISKITLSREQRDAATKLIQGHFITSYDEYKENLLLLGDAEVA